MVGYKCCDEHHGENKVMPKSGLTLNARDATSMLRKRMAGAEIAPVVLEMSRIDADIRDAIRRRECWIMARYPDLDVATECRRLLQNAGFVTELLSRFVDRVSWRKP